MIRSDPKENLNLDAAGAMMGLLNGGWAARLVHAAAELGIADYLADGERDADSLALATKAHVPSLARLLRALSAIGVLHGERRTPLHTHVAWRHFADRRARLDAGMGALSLQR